MRKLKKLNSTQVAELKAFIKDNKNTPCEMKRAQAIVSLHNNSSAEDINDLTGFVMSSVFKIRKKYIKQGIKALETKKRKPKALLTKEQRKNITKILNTNTKYDFHLINFPIYSPDKNPQEHVWKAGRQKISHNKFIKDIDKTTNEFVDYLNTTKFNYKFLDLN